MGKGKNVKIKQRQHEEKRKREEKRKCDSDSDSDECERERDMQVVVSRGAAKAEAHKQKQKHCHHKCSDSDDDDDKAKQEIILCVQEVGNTLGIYRFDGEPLGTIRLGYLPHEIAVTYDYSTAYVTVFGVFDYAATAGDQSGYTIAVIDVKNKVLKDRLYLFREGSTLTQRAPHGVKLNGPQTKLYVSCEYRNEASASVPSLVVFDLTTDNKFPAEVVPLPDYLSRTHNIMFSQDFRYIFTQSARQGLGLYDTVSKTFAPTAVFHPDSAIQGLAIAGDYQLLVSGTDEAWILDVSNPYAPTVLQHYGPFGVGQIIYSSPTEDKRYITMPAAYGQQMLIVDRKSGMIAKSIITDLNPETCTTSLDSKYVFVSPGNGSYLFRVDLKSPGFPILKIWTGLDSAPNRLALIPDIGFREPKVLRMAVILPLSGAPDGLGANYRPIGTVMRNTIAYWQELKNLQAGIYSAAADRAYLVKIKWYNDRSSDIVRNALVTKALHGKKHFDLVLACHPSTSALPVEKSGRLIGYPFNVTDIPVPYVNNLSYNDWQSIPNLEAALLARFNVPATNEQITTSGVLTLVQRAVHELSLCKIAKKGFVGLSIYYFGFIITMLPNRDIVVLSA